MTHNVATLAMTAATVAMAVTSAPHTQIAHSTPSGLHVVGKQNFVWTDSTRRDPTDTTRWRQVSAFVWYPAAARKGAQTEAPLPPEWEARRLQSLKTKLGPDIANAMREFTVHAQTNAPLLQDTSRLPVLLFTPGLSWLATDYSVLLEDLASHGYIVVGFSPSGFSDPVVFPDGRVVGQSLGTGASIGTDQSYIEDDALFVLREIRDLDRDGFLRGRIDLGRIGAFGHSIGGATSFAIAARDTAIRAAIDIDGDVMGEVREVRPHQPLLLISSDLPKPEEFPSDWPAKRVELTRQGLERSEKRRTDEWAALSNQSASANRVRIIGAQHLNFTDAALVSDHVQSREARWMKFGSIDAQRGLTITSELVRSFFDQIFGRPEVGDDFKSHATLIPQLPSAPSTPAPPTV
jgi:pimeloyl-ACP methyl ester carboxylesterase